MFFVLISLWFWVEYSNCHLKYIEKKVVIHTEVSDTCLNFQIKDMSYIITLVYLSLIKKSLARSGRQSF